MLERRRLLLMLGLIVAVLAVYGQTYGFDFVNLDDDAYVFDNPMVLRGFTVDGVVWAFTTGQEGHWSPLTWLSLMLDVQVFGPNPGALHLVNVALHLANALLLFAVLQRMTGALWPAWIVAALFALHPLHVESVAWISERKDVLSTLFWFLTLGAYTRYVETRSRSWYGATAALFVAGLLSKSMLVTLPFVLLLLDIWPLRRVSLEAGSSVAERESQTSARRGRKRQSEQPRVALYAQARALLLEKVPLLVLTLVFSALAYATQLHGHALVESQRLPLGVRAANSLVGYVRYLSRTLWPVDLAAFYPYDTSLPVWQPIGAALSIALVSTLVVRNVRTHPYAFVGWFWYLGTLVPVIGIVQIGGQALADRYTYVPLIGVFVAVVWTGRAFAAQRRIPPAAVVAGALVIIAGYAILAWRQVGVWRTSETLFSHAAAVTSDNALVYNNLGATLAARGDIEGALAQFRAAVRIAPQYAEAYNNVGAMLGRQGLRAEAASQYRMAVRIAPEYADAHRNLGTVLLELGQLKEAIVELTESVRLAPSVVVARKQLARALHEVGGRLPDAVVQYQQALQLQPDDPELHYLLGIALIESGQPEAALIPLRAAIGLKADYAEAYNDLGVAQMSLGRKQEAVASFQHALQLHPGLPDALENLRITQEKSGTAETGTE